MRRPRPLVSRAYRARMDTTRSTANAGLLAAVLFGGLCLWTTQVRALRETLPFTLDPYDYVVSYAMFAMPVIVGATWVRSLRHRGPRLERAVGYRIRLGVRLALAVVGITLISDAVAYAAPPADAGTELPIGVALLWLVTLAATIGAAILLRRADRMATVAGSPDLVPPDPAVEPDLMDDLLDLADGFAGRFEPARRPIRATQRFLARSRWSPRRHRILAGALVALVAGLAFDGWHAVVEGPPTALGLLVFGMLAVLGLFAIYLVTLRPLRLVRAD